MKISAAFPSKYLRAADLQDRDIRLIMDRVEMEDVGDADKKPVLYFTGKTKGLCLNKTNSKVIVNSYGDDTATWRGREIVLFPAMVDFKGDTVEAVRVKIPKPVTRPTVATPVAVSPPSTTFDEANPPPHDDTDIPF